MCSIASHTRSASCIILIELDTRFRADKDTSSRFSSLCRIITIFVIPKRTKLMRIALVACPVCRTDHTSSTQLLLTVAAFSLHVRDEAVPRAAALVAATLRGAPAASASFDASLVAKHVPLRYFSLSLSPWRPAQHCGKCGIKFWQASGLAAY